MRILLFLSFSFLGFVSLQAQSIAQIPRTVPPEGVIINEADRAEIEQVYDSLVLKLDRIDHEQKADVEIYAKAVRYALLNREFYDTQDVAKALKLLETAHNRADDLGRGIAPWANSKGVNIRGFYSAIDGSPQPYGIEIPDQVDLGKKMPLYIWLHGRGDKTTDMHFIAGRENAKMKFPNDPVITVYPLGRQCIGYKIWTGLPLWVSRWVVLELGI